jgi:hypothetical protein
VDFGYQSENNRGNRGLIFFDERLVVGNYIYWLFVGKADQDM